MIVLLDAIKPSK